MTNYVAVYGSLRQGLGNHRLLEQSELVGIHTVSLNYQLVDLGSFPGLLHTKWKTNPITVEVYAVDDETMESLDWLEGYPRFYNREQVEIGDKKAWIYFLADRSHYQHAPVVEAGDWKEYLHGRRSY